MLAHRRSSRGSSLARPLSLAALALLTALGTATAPSSAADPLLRPRAERVQPPRLRVDAGAVPALLADPRSAPCATSRTFDEYLLAQAARARAAVRAAALEDGPPIPATGALRNRDGVLILEADDAMLLRDNPVDLEGKSVRYVPRAGGGYDVTVEDSLYDANLGSAVLQDATSPTTVPIALAHFSFPLGGTSYATLYADTDLGLRTASGGTFAPNNLQYGELASDIAQDLWRDRVPRLSPYFFAQGGSLMGRTIHVNDTPEKLLITWKRSANSSGATFWLEAQAALYPSGEIVFSYPELVNADGGAAFVYDDPDAWIAGFVTRASLTDPQDVSLAAADLVGYETKQHASDDMLWLRSTYREPIPPSSASSIDYYVDVEQNGEARYRFYLGVNSGGRTPAYVYLFSEGFWFYLGAPAIDGATWEIFAALSDYPDLAPASMTFRPYVYVDGAQADSASTSGTIAAAPSLTRDLSAAAPFAATGPVVEPFLLPEFNTFAAKEKLLAATGWDETRIDGLPMYQAFFTDIIFFAGAYYTGGNCGAANIGRCDPGAPLAPGLLHMNKTNYGWNNSSQTFRFQVLSHELGHHWLQDILIDEGTGPSNVLNPESAHPAAYVHTEAGADIVYPQDTSVMGGGFWQNNGDGTWTSFDDYTYYSYTDYELYLMGLKGPGEVANWFYLADTDPPQRRSYWPLPDVTVTATPHTVTQQMLTDAMGFRDPAYPSAKRGFFAPLILVVRPGQEPSTADWNFMMSMRDPWRQTFAEQTQGRGSVTTISPREVAPDGTLPLRIEKLPGGDLRVFFEDPEFGDQVSFNLYEGALGGGFGDWAPTACNAPTADAGTELSIDTTPAAGSRYFLVTMSNVAYEGSAGAAKDGTERTTTTSRCGP